MKIQKYYVIFVTRQDGQDGKKNHATKVTKIPQTKRQKYGMNQTLVKQDCFLAQMSQHFEKLFVSFLASKLSKSLRKSFNKFAI